MARELKEFSQEEELNRKLRQKKRIRGCLIIANALLLTYFSYLLIDTIIDKVGEQQQIITKEIILLNGKSASKSKEIYEERISSTIDVNDFATYGKYLLTSSSRVTHTNVNYKNNVWLVDLLENPFVIDTDLKLTLGDKLDEQIDLFSLDNGDYMICDSVDTHLSQGVSYHYTGDDLLETTIYSFPDESNHRKKITIKGKESSPAMIISVEAINLLPTNHYDFVVIGNKEEFNVFNNTTYQVKYVNTLKEAYLTNASYAIEVKGEEGILTSNYVDVSSAKSSVITSSVYQGLDANNAIRELGGYVFNAGYGVSSSEVPQDISSASLEVKSAGKEVRNGKYTLVVGKNTTLSQIENIVK